MGSEVRTVVTFTNSSFNTTEPKDYFINPYCFGDDVAMWFMQELGRRGITTGDKPGQEDFGWYLDFDMSDGAYCLVVGYRPGDTEGEHGRWVCQIEQRRGLIASLLGGRKRGIGQAALQAIHAVLSGSPEAQEVRWHLDRDFSAGHEDRGTPTP